MAHRLYQSFWSFQKPLAPLTPIIYADFDDALGRAKIEIERGLRVHRIESDDGNTQGPDEIRRLIRERGPALVGRPRVH